MKFRNIVMLACGNNWILWVLFAGAFPFILVNGAFGQAKTSSDEFEIQFVDKPEKLQNWHVKDQEGNIVELERLRGNASVILLFRGHGCYRCMDQLVKFSEVESKFRECGVRLIGVTSEAVDEMKMGLSTYPVPFSVFADPNQSLFETMDRQSVENLHKVLVLDSIGRLRWQACGSKPYLDYRTIQSIIQELRLENEPLDTHIVPR